MTKSTIRLADIYGGDAHYCGDNSTAAIEGLPAEAWPALVAACEELTGGGTDPGIDCDVCKTHETFADFDRSRDQHWSERGGREELEIGGYPAIKYERFQLRKGAPRATQIVVDLGDCRAALT